MTLAYAGSREFAGRPVREIAPEIEGDLVFEALGPDAVAARSLDAVILALPNGAAAPFVAALSDETGDWSTFRPTTGSTMAGYTACRRFMAAMQSAARGGSPIRVATPLRASSRWRRCAGRLAGDIHVFGVSGYSGAGTTPSRKNDPEALADNLMPYALTGHIHEAEMSRHLGEAVRFTPHVAEFFRGIVTTVHVRLADAATPEGLLALYREAYAGEALVDVVERIPEVRDGAGRPGAVVGGFAVGRDGRHAVIVSALDNLLKGAATQAMQNLALALGLEEMAGLAG